MYRLVRVEDRFHVVEGSASRDVLAADDVNALALQGRVSQLWNPCLPPEKETWSDFLKTGKVEPARVRSAILESWQRSKDSNVECDGSKCRNLLSGQDLEQRRGLLCEVSEPIMETLYHCVRDSGSLIVLVDRDGYILASLGDLTALRQAEKLNFGPGANWTEGSVGTNAIGMALTLGFPMQVTGAEHYSETHHVWTCAATPIRDPEGNIIGTLDISGPREKAHFHSLGMTVAAVRAIEERFRLEQSHEYYLNVSNHLSTILNSVSEGLITVDNNGLISGINIAAAKLMNQHPRDLVGRTMDEVMKLDGRLRGFMQGSREYSEEELVLKSERGPVRCIGSANPICGENQARLGAVFTFSRMKESFLPKGGADLGDTRFMFKDIIGESAAMRETLDKAKRFAKGPSTILILGESGTGKELFAQAVHNASDRRNGPFISVNCGAICGELIQSELFGYVEGAFTGAKKGGHPGKLELANGGSIFLDEIAEMPIHMQVNLLRVLEERSIVRVGDSKVVPVDVRIITATNKSLYEEVTRGRFREDLFYRLNVIALFIPPLRERTGDVALLIQHFVERISLKVGKNVRRIEPAFLAALEAHHWPGNVRELSNALEYAINMLQGEELLFSHLPVYLKKEQKGKPTLDDADVVPLQLVEKRAIQNALVYFDGNISKAAGALGIGRNTLYEKMKKYGIRA